MGEISAPSRAVAIRFEVKDWVERAGWQGEIPLGWNPAMYVVSFLSQAAVKLEFDDATIELSGLDPSIPLLIQDLRAALQTAGGHEVRDHPYLEGSFFLDVRGDVVILTYSGYSTGGQTVTVAALRTAWEQAINSSEDRIRGWIAREIPAALDDSTIGPWLRGESSMPPDIAW